MHASPGLWCGKIEGNIMQSFKRISVESRTYQRRESRQTNQILDKSLLDHEYVLLSAWTVQSTFSTIMLNKNTHWAEWPKCGFVCNQVSLAKDHHDVSSELNETITWKCPCRIFHRVASWAAIVLKRVKTVNWCYNIRRYNFTIGAQKWRCFQNIHDVDTCQKCRTQ